MPHPISNGSRQARKEIVNTQPVAHRESPALCEPTPITRSDLMTLPHRTRRVLRKFLSKKPDVCPAVLSFPTRRERPNGSRSSAAQCMTASRPPKSGARQATREIDSRTLPECSILCRGDYGGGAAARRGAG